MTGSRLVNPLFARTWCFASKNGIFGTELLVVEQNMPAMRSCMRTRRQNSGVSFHVVQLQVKIIVLRI